MAYANGTANSITDILNALRTACTANGWTLSGEVLSKNDCYVRLYVTGTELRVRGGTGIDGSNLLTGASVQDYRMTNITWPANYEIHINAAPDEVYLIVNCSGDAYPWLAFGKSPVAGNPDNGHWAGATYNTVIGIPGGSALGGLDTGINGKYNSGWQTGALFWSGYQDGSPNDGRGNADVNHGVGGGDVWSSAASALASINPLIQRQPNSWNGEAILLPINPTFLTASNKVCRVASISHARYIRIDNYAPGDLITLGTDKWKVYPWLRKSTLARDGGHDADHTGTFGWAVRYTGP